MGVGIKIGSELAFPSEYLAAEDLNGREVTVEIESVTIDEVKLKDGKKERKAILSFKGAKKRLLLNKTNAKTIKAIHGPAPGDIERDVTKLWVGKAITLYPTTTNAFGEVTDCVRVRKQKVN
jgi:hypothetical protein